jgi:hypothetical protein
VQVGSDILVVLNVVGTVASVDVTGGPGVPWVFMLDVASAAGETGVDGHSVSLPDDLTSQPSEWWMRQQILDAEPMMTPGSTYSRGDGSVWVVGTDGRVICTAAGSTFAKFHRARRGELDVLPGDLYNPPVSWPYAATLGVDADELDWIPYPAAGIGVGQYVSAFTSNGTGVVDDIVATEYATHTRYEWKTGGLTLGWRDVPTDEAVSTPGHTWTVFERSAVPAADTLWSAEDGSLWVHVGSGEYICYGPGTRYFPGSGARRGDIPGGLVGPI